MKLDKLKNKKTISAFVTVLIALLSSFGLELGNETTEFIRDLLISVFTGAGAGGLAMKKHIETKIKDNVLNIEAGVKAADLKVQAVTAKAKAELGDSAAAFIEAELNPMTDELKALTGIEWKF